MTNVPHFDYPFRLRPDGHPVVCEQDSLEDVESCLVAVLLTEEGQRIELPEFGIVSPLFRLQPLDLQELYDSITEHEPRAVITLSQQPDALSYLSALIEIDLTDPPPTIGES